MSVLAKDGVQQYKTCATWNRGGGGGARMAFINQAQACCNPSTQDLRQRG